MQFLGDTDLSVVYALISCQEHTVAPSPTSTSFFYEGFENYIDSSDLRMALSFIALWLTYNQPIDANGMIPDELSVSRTWPLVMTILSHEFMSMGIYYINFKYLIVSQYHFIYYYYFQKRELSFSME